MITNEFNQLADNVKKFLENESSGHDFYHAKRVFNNANHIQKYEGGDKLIIGSAALVHDICRPFEKKTGKSHFGKEALTIIENVLHKSNLPEDKIKPILEIIELHDIYDWTEKNKNKSIELQIVQDADNLDAIGAIGIGRTFAFGGANSRPMYIPGENLTFTKDFIDNPNCTTSTIAHFYEKLLKLKQNMNTKTGIRIAEQRNQVMENFLKQFFDEWNGNFN
ncbi:MAG: HD domain-containing protein [Candidatus Shapirobacteria bacterium]|nr:HD domain-containing protein [Candidatus Shapirobacteria bacterium]